MTENKKTGRDDSLQSYYSRVDSGDELKWFMRRGTHSGERFFHLFTQMHDRSLCGSVSVVRNQRGGVHRRKCHRFTGFDQKPGDAWCSRCRRLFERMDGGEWADVADSYVERVRQDGGVEG